MNLERSNDRFPALPRNGAAISALMLAGLLPACGSGAAPTGSLDGSGAPAAVDSMLEKPDGEGLYIVDPSRGGQASDFRIEEMFYGRLVDVYELCRVKDTNLSEDTNGDGINDDSTVVRTFRFRDFVIGEDIATDALSYSVTTNPVTQETELGIRTEFVGDAADYSPTEVRPEFLPLLEEAEDAARPLSAKDPNGLPPFPFVARNSTISLRFSDALSPTSIGPTTVQVLAGSPPTDPFEARIIPDPNHGIIAAGLDQVRRFYSTRVLIDLTVSEIEAEAADAPLALNSLGLPPSSESDRANIAIRIPSRADFPSGQFDTLQNVTGHPISVDEATNAPIDLSVTTVDVVRALRAGSETDANNGFLRDLDPPVILGELTLQVASALDNPSGVAGFDFLADLVFDDPTCALRPQESDIVNLAGRFFQVTAPGQAPVAGEVFGVHVQSLQSSPAGASSLVGRGVYVSTFEPLEGDRPECFVSLIPRPQVPPTDGLDPMTQVRVRYSEPMDPASVTAFDTFMLTRSIDDEIHPTDVVSGTILSSADLQTFTFTPSLGLSHEQGSSETYFFSTNLGKGAVVDLAGNAVGNLLPSIELSLRNQALPQNTGNYVLRFTTRDEDLNSTVDQSGNTLVSRPEIRGQFLYNLDAGLIRPRPVSRFRAVADRNHPVTSLMNLFPPGVQTPLSPLGSRLMTVWRYCDFNFALGDESLHNLDVEGISWAPRNGQVVADSYEEFRIRLCHSNRQPDEYLGPTSNLPDYPQSGLLKGKFESVSPTGNLLVDEFNELTVVHPKEKGYLVNPSNVYTSDSGTKLMPFPLNDGVPPDERVFWTWRDTRIINRGAPDGAGVDLNVLETAGLVGPEDVGTAYGAKAVPSIGLPILMEYSCYPSDSGVGLNSFDVSLAINSSGQPNFRLFATGGIDGSGQPIAKDPDLTAKATGGFNPSASGAKTRGFDVIFYHGALDIIVRVSRVITIWIDAGEPSIAKDFSDPVVEPAPQDQPLGTAVKLAFRGAVDGVWVGADDDVFDANTYDPYGNSKRDSGGAPFWGVFDLEAGDFAAEFFSRDDDSPGPQWFDSIHEIDGASFVQVRISFVGNPESGLTPVLSAVALPYERMAP